MKDLKIDGYGQIELNQVAFRRDGRIEAQCKLDANDFAEIPAENGMLLMVDNVKRTVHLPGANVAGILALHYSAEHMYDERKPGLKNFKLEVGEFLPRLGYLAVGDKFTSNCLAYDDNEFEATETETVEEVIADALDAVATTPMYGVRCELGAIQLTAEANGADLLVIKKTTMPDGQLGVKFQAIR